MKKNFINQTKIEGYLYEHKLEKRVTGPNSKNPGTAYITGTIGIATDVENITNVIPIHFTYVTATTAKGAVNNTFTTLSNIIEGRMKTYMDAGIEGAAKLKVDSTLGVNEFYNKKNELVSTTRNEGGFVSTVKTFGAEKERQQFKCDMIITSAKHKDADEDRHISERTTIKGFVFNFRGDLLPVEFIATNPAAMNYFEGLEITSSHPMFTQVSGSQISTTYITRKVQESAFGPDIVTEYPNSRKEFLVEFALREEYPWGDENFMTDEDYQKLKNQREITIAELKARNEQYLESLNKPTTIVSASSSEDTYNF